MPARNTLGDHTSTLSSPRIIRRMPQAAAPMEAAETTLLDHAPSTAVEAVCMIEIIRQGLADAGRSDGRDMRALAAIQSWLAGTALEASPDRRDEVEQLLKSVKRANHVHFVHCILPTAMMRTTTEIMDVPFVRCQLRTIQLIEAVRANNRGSELSPPFKGL